LLLSHFAQINLDCSSRGRIEIRVISGPSSGTIRTVHRADYEHFTGDYERCNTVKVAGESVYYTPAKGFTGSDSVEIDIFLTTGVEKTDSFTITVK